MVFFTWRRIGNMMLSLKQDMASSPAREASVGDLNEEMSYALRAGHVYEKVSQEKRLIHPS